MSIKITNIEAIPKEMKVNDIFNVYITIDGEDELLNKSFINLEDNNYLLSGDDKKIKLEGR